MTRYNEPPRLRNSTHVTSSQSNSVALQANYRFFLYFFSPPANSRRATYFTSYDALASRSLSPDLAFFKVETSKVETGRKVTDDGR